jgi:alpha-beta hydrolase superfamily lysophospholipase
MRSKPATAARPPWWAVIVVAGALTACSHHPSPPAASPAGPPAGASASSSAEAATPDQAPGTILGADDLPGTAPALAAASGWAKRITYASTSGIDDHRTRVSGSVLVPHGVAPQGGWPIVALGHPTTGTAPDCAPSQSPTLLDTAATVEALLQGGYVVTIPDYQGLGTGASPNTYYPYLDSTTVGYNLIDAVRAARKLVPNTSGRWVALGLSEGGQAAWAADELADNYGWDTTLLGSASLTPIANIDALADDAEAGSLTNDQRLTLATYLSALKREYGADFNLDDYRRGMDANTWNAFSACRGPASTRRAALEDQITADDLRPATTDATATLRSYLQKTSLPQAPAKAPMLVVYGGQDNLVPPAWTDQALQRACGMGDVVESQLVPGAGHNAIDPSTAFDWIGERFADRPAPNSCPPPDPGQAGANPPAN